MKLSKREIQILMQACGAYAVQIGRSETRAVVEAFILKAPPGVRRSLRLPTAREMRKLTVKLVKAVVGGMSGGTMVERTCSGCGDRKRVRARNIRRPRTTSRCSGCSGNDSPHGHTKGKRSFTYYSWENMIQRVTNPRHPKFSYYGGRGITADARWQGPGGFANFLSDMGVRPDGRSLDRADVDGNYEKANCRWATASEQQRNKQVRA